MAQPDYHARAAAGIRALQRWYLPHTGRWGTTGWWNAANALTAVIRYIQHTGDHVLPGDHREHVRGGPVRDTPGFINSFFDDNGWWALAWVAAYDLTAESRYLDAARTIFAHNLGGWDGTCRRRAVVEPGAEIQERDHQRAVPHAGGAAASADAR